MMENKFTPRAEEALPLAQEAAEDMGHGYVGSEHLLLGLLREEEGIAHRVLEENGLTDEMVCDILHRSVGTGVSGAAPSQGLTPRAKSAVELAVSEAARTGAGYIGTEHLLMGLLREGNNMALRILRTVGIDPKKLYSAVVKKLNEAPRTAAVSGSASAPAQEGGKKGALEEYTRDLTGAARSGKLDPVIGREKEIQRVIQILSRRTKNNPCLIGEPGVGKSTMLLQLCGAISNQHSVLYITGEESVRQVKLRAARLKVPQDNIFLAAENDVDEICGLIEKEKPDLVVIDSIQTMRCMDISSSSGTVSQVKESAARLLAVAKKQEIPMFIVGHVNKDGAIAGPKVMEHIVDTVLYFEGDKMLPYRILRAAKNRYGSTNELGMFDMTGTGLAEIENPSQMLLEGRPLGVSGNCVACTMEGSRPILSEIQALATKTNFPAPRRACSGYDYNRMNLLIAVLEKRAGYFFGNLDVYVNIVGGIALRDTACDLSVCLSMVSSLLDRPVSDKLIAIGEVGLGGEVRSVPNLEQRLHEAERIGFERAVVPKHSLNHLNPADYPGMKLIGAAYISDAINALKTDRL